MTAYRTLAWLAILAPLPYGISRVLWACGLPVGISESMLHDELNSPGRGSLAILLLVVLTEGTALFTHAFVLSRAERVPGWIPLLRGRSVRPSLVAGALLAPIVILAASNLQTIAVVLGTVEPSDGLPGWSLWGQMTVFMVWGCALTAATLAYWRSMPRPVLAAT